MKIKGKVSPACSLTQYGQQAAFSSSVLCGGNEETLFLLREKIQVVTAENEKNYRNTDTSRVKAAGTTAGTVFSSVLSFISSLAIISVSA